jgi:hypothetical protein
MTRDLRCVASTIAETAKAAQQQGTLTELLGDLTILFAGAWVVTLRELNHQVLMQELDEKVHQQADR